ncbi:MAG: hypothetical protein DPW16_06435 [Chloroflexi bacterium]|nr:hypothetical protein [Chloroflexota bacterium]
MERLPLVRKALSLTVVVIGFGLVLIGLASFFMESSPIHAQDNGEPEYVGAGECSDCHRDYSQSHKESRHARALIEADDEDFPILADFSKGEDVRQVTFPGASETRAFTLDDVVYAVGSGRYVQRYLYATGEDEYQVLPAEWNTLTQEWQALTLAETWPDPAYDWNQNCAGCHTTGFELDKGEWEDEGVQCEACHGPGLAHVEAADDAGSRPTEEELQVVRDAIVVSPDAQICGRCHSQGTEVANGLPYAASYLPGDTLVQDGVFTLTPPEDHATWWASGHGKQPNMQFNEWFNSAHANSLTNLKASEIAEDSCLECHSVDYRQRQALIAKYESGEIEGTPPEPITIESAQYGITCSTCHVTHSDTPPADYLLTKEPYALCVDCHSNGRTGSVHYPVQEMYEGDAIVAGLEGIPSGHFTAENGPDCLTCHMPSVPVESATRFSHTLSPVAPGDAEEGQPDSCTNCHTDLEKDYAQNFIQDTQEGIHQRLLNIETVYAQVAEPEAWIRTILDFIGQDGSLGIHNFAYTDALLDKAEITLGVVQDVSIETFSPGEVADPAECAECHRDEHRQWQTSPHANASLSQTFLDDYSENGRPTYCMRCHASGYDSQTQQYVFEGVTCTSCHTLPEGGAEHPPSPIAIADESSTCGSCHSGAHAPSYDEWLLSTHSSAGIDCVDCHTPHDNGLILEDINTTCSGCHQEALIDEVHMADDMTCVDCHMSQRNQRSGIVEVTRNHTMGIDPGVCSNCHGNTHLLSVRDSRQSPEEASEVEDLQADVKELEETSDQNLYSGVIGGAIGMLILLFMVFAVIRFGRIR